MPLATHKSMQHTRGRKHHWRPRAWRSESAQPLSVVPQGCTVLSCVEEPWGQGWCCIWAQQHRRHQQARRATAPTRGLPHHDRQWCRSLSGTVPPDHWATNGELITTSHFHPCRRRGSSLLKSIGTHCRCGFRFPAWFLLFSFVWHHYLRAHRKQNWLTQGISQNHPRPRDPLTAHQGLRGQVAMGSKVAISAPTVQKLLVLCCSGTASTKHTWGAHWDMRARGADIYN